MLGLTAPIRGPKLVSAVGDVGGFVHTNLRDFPAPFANPVWSGVSTILPSAGKL